MNGREIDTDFYDSYAYVDNETTSSRQGSPYIDPETGNPVYDPKYLFTRYNSSTMDMDDVNTGLMNDFWTDYPVVIDVNGNVFYNGDFTGINVRGPQGLTSIQWDNLTPEQKETLKGADGAPGINGTNGRDGVDGEDGLSAYQVWLQENGWLDDPEHHPIEDFWAFLSNYTNNLIAEGAGTGSLILNYHGEQNTAIGAGSSASGLQTRANGNYSASFGLGTTANREASFVIGKYNKGETNNLFEVGNGTSVRLSNAFEVDYQGNTKAYGEVEDGGGNLLSNKVDKISGKGLSTNDFNNTYKTILDNYQVDTRIDPSSHHPVENMAVAAEFARTRTLNTQVQQDLVSGDTDLPIAHPTVSSGQVGIMSFSNVLTFNPQKNNLLSNTTTTNRNVLGFGEGLLANDDNQIVLGYYNDPQQGDVLEIGAGTSTNRKNIARLTSQGNLYIDGEIQDKTGNILSHKQNILQYDSVPTQYSTNLVNSGDLYDYLKAHGIDPNAGIVVPGLASLQAQVDTLQATVTALSAALTNDVSTINTRITNEVNTLNTRITTVANTHELIDDYIPTDTYDYGVNNGQFYIRLQVAATPEPEPSSGDNNEEEGE